MGHSDQVSLSRDWIRYVSYVTRPHMKVSLTLCISQFQQCSSPSPPGNRGAFAHVVSPGVGTFAIIAARGLGICVPRGDPRGFDTGVFESAMDEFIVKDEAFVEQWLVRRGLEKLADVFKVMFSQSQFRYFFITCKHKRQGELI